MFGIILVSAVLATLGSAQNCVLQVPADPLTAKGLSTPYVQSNCSQRADTASFVECAIYDGKGNIQYYAPLIVDQGDVVGTDFIAPIVPTLPANPTVGCWFGTNGGSTTLAGPGAAQCTNGLPGGTIFGQFATCNGAAFMAKTIADAQRGILTVPPLGTASIGGSCPTTRDFRVVDQDQSDNVVTEYTLINGHIIAQSTKNNTAGANETLVLNGSDNVLVAKFVDPALGCTPWMVPSITAPTGLSAGLATNELQANFHQADPHALVPSTDPMVLDNGNPSLQKTNLYRAATGQTPALSLNQAAGLPYCTNITAGGIFTAENQALLVNNPSPAPAAANNLFTFLAQRFAASINADNLNCLGLWNLTVNPVTLTMDGNGIVIDATINVAVLQQLALGKTVTNTTATTSSSATASSSATTSSASSTTSVMASATASFTAFKNTTNTISVGASATASSSAILSLSSNQNKGATVSPTTLATVTMAGTNTQSNVVVPTSSAVLGGGTGTSSSAAAVLGGGTGTSSTAAAVGSATCTCPTLTAPVATAPAATASTAAAPVFTLLSDGLVQNTQSGQLYIPLPAFFNNFFAGGQPGGGRGRH